MEGKKLTDEEIIKALECCINSEGCDCENCPYNNNDDCQHRSGEDLLDLIHRLQNENEKLKDEKQLAFDTVKGYSLTDIEQKAEIERLTKYAKKIKEDNDACWDCERGLIDINKRIKQKNAELQKQVDELQQDLERLDAVQALNETLMLDNDKLTKELSNAPDPFPCKVGSGCESAGKGCYDCPNNRYRESAVKDTAKEIYSEINYCIEQGQEYCGLDWRGLLTAKNVILVYCKKKGVEVE